MCSETMKNLGNGYSYKGKNSHSDREMLSPFLNGGFFLRKEFAPSGRKFFPLKVALIFEGFQLLGKQLLVCLSPFEKFGGKILQLYPFS